MTMQPTRQPRDQTLELQQKLARVQSLLEAARRVHSTIRLDDVLAGVLEVAAKELEAQGAFFVSGSPELQARATVYGDVPDDWSRWTESANTPGYTGAVLPGERGEILAHLVVYREEPLSLEEADFLAGFGSAIGVGNWQCATPRTHDRMGARQTRSGRSPGNSA
jgi:hypothetical protein